MADTAALIRSRREDAARARRLSLALYRGEDRARLLAWADKLEAEANELEASGKNQQREPPAPHDPKSGSDAKRR